MKIILLMTLSGVYLFLALSIEHTFTRFLFFGVAIWLFIWGYKELKESADKREEQLESEMEKVLNDIPHTQCVMSDDFLSALLIDEDNENVYVINREKLSSDFQKETYQFNDIMEAALIENGKIKSFITKGAKIQNSLLNEKSEITQQDQADKGVRKISVKLLVNNLSKPEVEYIFFESDQSLSKETEEYKEVMETCKDWFQKISLIIRRSEAVPIRQWE